MRRAFITARRRGAGFIVRCCAMFAACVLGGMIACEDMARAEDLALCEDGQQASLTAVITSVDRMNEVDDLGFYIRIGSAQGTCAVAYVQVPGSEAPFGCEAGHYVKTSGLVAVDGNGTPFLDNPVDLACH